MQVPSSRFVKLYHLTCLLQVFEVDLLFLIPNNVKRMHGIPITRISGKKRFDTKDNEYKFVAYQTNGSEGRLGSEITTEMVNADASNEGQIKFITMKKKF